LQISVDTGDLKARFSPLRYESADGFSGDRVEPCQYYEYGVKSLLAFDKLADERMNGKKSTSANALRVGAVLRSRMPTSPFASEVLCAA
jgi:hypothetical protein